MGNLFEFELSPKLKGIYRRDYAKHSDFGVEEYNQIDAIVLTHAYVGQSLRLYSLCYYD